MKKPLFLALALGSYAAFAATPSRADAVPPPPPPAAGAAGDDMPPPPPDADGGFQGGPFGHLFKQLGLSDAQNKQIAALRDKNKAQMKDLGKQLFQAREQLSALMTAHTSLDQAKAQHQKIEVLGQQLADLRFNMMYEVAGVLTVDQRTQFQSLQKDMANKWHHHHGEGGPHEGPHYGPDDER